MISCLIKLSNYGYENLDNFKVYGHRFTLKKYILKNCESNREMKTFFLLDSLCWIGENTS